MSAIALPGSGSSLGRFAFNAAGAGVGLMVGAQYVAPALPASLTSFEIVGGFGGQEIVLGACALVGAMLGNTIYNKVSGK